MYITRPKIVTCVHVVCYRVKEMYVHVYNQTQNSFMCTSRLLPSQRDVCSGIGRPITSSTVDSLHNCLTHGSYTYPLSV